MFRTKLYLAFFTLVLITILQAGLASWAGQVASVQVERGRIANQMLTEFIALGADKQRLKVWLAQALLTKEAPLEQRDHYLARMQQNLQQIHNLLLQDQGLAQNADDYQVIAQQLKNLSILETNVDALKRSLLAKSRQQQIAPRSEADIWRLLIQTFDNLEGLDLKKLIAESIAIQKQRSAAAEQAASKALQQTKVLLIGCGLFGVLAAAIFAFLLARTSYRPLQSLLEGTAAISRGDLAYRLPEQGNAEFALLSRSFNQMAAALERAHHAEIAQIQQTEHIVHERTAQLQQALQELQHAETQQQQFLADVSHELRTPATAIRGEAEVMLRGHDKSSDEYKDSLLRIVDTSAQLSNRIDELLMLVRGDRQLQIRFKQYRLAQLWPQWQALAQRVEQSSGIPLHWPALDDATLQVALYVDAERCLQALQIVLDNAVKYGQGQPIWVSLQPIMNDRQSPQLALHVYDAGIGIPAAEQHRLFERYYRASNAQQQRPDGLGIGLSLCRAIMHAQHGDVMILSHDAHDQTVLPPPHPTLDSRGSTDFVTRVSLIWPLVDTDDDIEITVDMPMADEIKPSMHD